MSEQLYWIFTGAVEKGNLDDFKSLVREMVAAARKEPGTLSYEFALNADETMIQIFERYSDSASAVSHVQETFAPFTRPFMSLVEGRSLTVYGQPDAEARAVLDTLGATYMVPFDGFLR